MDDVLSKSSEIVIPAIPVIITDGRDEMNLAEWPIALIASNGKSSASQSDPNTLVFRDTVRHPKTGQMIQRTFTVSGTSKWGLPGPADDEVLLALIQLTKFAQFTSNKLYFTRYHLLVTLGWPTNGKYYDRLKQSLKRLEGVQLDFERAYWSEEAQSWEDRTFSLYNDLRILEEENSTSKKPDPRQPAFSSFSCELTWSNFLFDGLNKRTLKHLDFDHYRRLKSAIAKRLFRFLDKRLYNERHASLRMPLNTFSVSHVGLADGQPQREYKRRLKPALAELEQTGFIKLASEKERFKKLQRGCYEIFIERIFEEGAGRAGEQKTVPSPQTPPPMAAELIQAGMHKDQAIKIATTRPETEIRRKLDILKWRKESGDPPHSPGAWLNDQFRGNYPDPDGYVAHVKSLEANHVKQGQKKELDDARIAREKATTQAISNFRAAFDLWWQGLGDAGRSEVDEVIRNAEQNDFERRYIKEGEGSIHGRSIWTAKRQNIFSERTRITAPE